jgi:hypothetical protein
MRGEKAGVKRLLSVMPKGWEDKAKELGALVRGREIKSVLDLPQLVFLYLSEGKSFSGIAALLQRAGICSISKKAVFKRFQKSGEWLRRLCESVCRNNKAIREAPLWLGDRKAYLADAGGEPARVEASARAWFYGKLLLAALCETWVNKRRFSPSAGKRSR